MIFYEKLKQNEKTYNVRVAMGRDQIFVFADSLPIVVIPEVGNEIVSDFEDAHFLVTKVIPLLVQNNELSNYALTVELK